jgi:hypothetical protein
MKPSPAMNPVQSGRSATLNCPSQDGVDLGQLLETVSELEQDPARSRVELGELAHAVRQGSAGHLASPSPYRTQRKIPAVACAAASCASI